MSINATVTRRRDGGWDFSWPAGVAPYSVWLDGRLLASPATPSFTFGLPGYDDAPPDLEILSAGDPSQNQASPPYQLLQWRGNQNAAAYVVEQFVSGAWVTLVTITETRSGYYAFETPPQPDGAAVQYRVRAVDVFGNSGAPLLFSLEVARNPERPDVVASYAAGLLTIEATP